MPRSDVHCPESNVYRFSDNLQLDLLRLNIRWGDGNEKSPVFRLAGVSNPTLDFGPLTLD
jgi:hypothetical protein